MKKLINRMTVQREFNKFLAKKLKKSVIEKRLQISSKRYSQLLYISRKFGSRSKGRRRIISKLQLKKYLLHRSKSRPLNPKEIVEFSNSILKTISINTARRYLHDLHYNAFKPPIKIHFTKAEKENRVKFAKKYENFDFTKIIFMDESKFENMCNKDMHWVMKRKNIKSFRPRRKFAYNVLGAVCFHTIFKVIKIEGSLNSKLYRKCINLYLKEYKKIYKNNDFYILQDNCSSHFGKGNSEWFEQNKIKMIRIPPRSPDINVIENFWSIIKNQISRQNIFKQYDLDNSVCESFLGISEEIRKNIIKSWPKRMRLIIEKKGELIDY